MTKRLNAKEPIQKNNQSKDTHSRFSDEQVQQFLEQGQIQTMDDVQSALKELFGRALQAMLEGEMDHHLGYQKNRPKNEPQNKQTTNRRNGHAFKSVRSDYGDIALCVPRDRQADFEPQIIKKRQKNITGLEDQILALYAKGLSTRDIQDHLERLYGIEVSPTFISNVTDQVLAQIQEWQSRPLAAVYSLVFLDAVHFKVRQEGRIVSKAAHIMIGVDLEGMKDVLGIWIGPSESAKFWLSTLSEIQARGVADILICCTDNLSGFSEAIQAVFPQALIQKCLVHQVRSSLRYVSYKDVKAVVAAMKAIYTASSEDQALVALGVFEADWGDKYPLVIASWRRNWSEISPFFGFAPQLRRLIYTTNMIEGFHRQLRKVTKGKSVFPTDESLLKMLYLATLDVQRKWTVRMPHWGQILAQLAITFEGRINIEA